ncbi:MAG: Hemolysins and related proteins containing CBS domains [uncultured Quadrisphaera sp.]|uniref:Hemolysins and related proteins containing CBS domains n=1 Tax=uncultured Quadrisphaera sp. TaxID=904978 RepID=A0A6J4Q6T4_9ACTN|nr:MAG: Hemolysins and related proteins containing CBS domains [uncultured Quadrisphaera sp.]
MGPVPAWLEIVLVLVFVLVGGFFSMSELAVVSLRDGQVRTLRESGRRGAAVGRLRDDTNRFLSAVQIGVTLAGFFASAFGGAVLARRLEPTIAGFGLAEAAAGTVALVAVTILVSYASLVLGELVPKRLALQKTEPISLAVAPVLDRVASVTRPVVWVLGVSTNAVVRLLGLDPRADRDEVSEEELREMVSSHGELADDERRVIDDVFDAADRRLSEVMIPRTEVAFLAASMGLEQAAEAVEHQPHSRYPVTGESADDVLGFVHVRDLLTAARRGEGGTLADIARPIAMLPGTKALLPALTELRRARRHLAVVVDEYGGTDGIVTLEDLVEELVGEIEDEYDTSPEHDEALGGPFGAQEVDGLLHRSEVVEQTGLALPDGPYETLGGFVVTALGRMPSVGDAVEALGHRLEVREMDGRRAARIWVEPLPDDGRDGDGPAHHPEETPRA